MTNAPPDDRTRAAREMREMNQGDRNSAIADGENVIDVRARLLSGRMKSDGKVVYRQPPIEDDCA